MSNSTEKSNKPKSTNKKTKAEPFVWTDDEVDLLLSVVLEYKVSRTSENVDWETCQSKYSDILELFQAQYPSPENAAQLGKEHEKISNFIDLRHRFQIVAVTVRPHVSGFVAFSKVSTLESVFKSLRLRCAFSPDTCGR